MGAGFSSNQLAGGTSGGIPTISYAYSTGNLASFGADATYTFDGPYGPFGEVTPYLVQPAAPTVTCSPISAFSSSQSLRCPVAGTALSPGLYTLSFSQYTSTAAATDSLGTVSYTISSGGDNNTLTDWGGDYTFSIVQATATVTVTPITVESTTITSGISDIPPSATDTVPQLVQTVTVYATTIISASTALSTLSDVSTVVTVTAPCPTTLSSSSSTRRGCGQPPPSITSTFQQVPRKVRRTIVEFYAPPDFTYDANSNTQPTSTVTGSPISTDIFDIPSTTIDDPDATSSFGTSTSTDNLPSTVTVTIVQSTVDVFTVSTITVSALSCS